MALTLDELLETRHVAVTSGCSYQQFEDQFIDRLPKNVQMNKLLLFPTCSASGYYYDKNRHRFYQAYSHHLSAREIKKILRAFEMIFTKLPFSHVKKTYGPIFENRGSQLTYSALGQKAPLRVKQRWDPKQRKRLKMRQLLLRQLPGFEITIGGTTSIDVTRKGVNKTLCVDKIKKRLHMRREDMLFVGDALFKGGNDYIMKSTGLKCVPVTGPNETRRLIKKIIQTPLVAH